MTRTLTAPIILLFLLSFFVVHSGFGQSAAALSMEKNYNSALQKKDISASWQYALELGDFHLSQSRYDKAIGWYNTAVKHASTLKSWSGEFNALEGLGASYFSLNQYGKAADAFEKSVRAAQGGKSKPEELSGLINQSKAEQANDRIKRTIPLLEKALPLAIDLKNEEIQVSIYKKLAENHQKLGNASQAKVYQNLYEQMTNAKNLTQQSEQKVNALNQKVSKAQTEKVITENLLEKNKEKLKQTEDSLHEAAAISRDQQFQIDLLNKDKELQEMKIREQHAELENDRLWRNSLIAGISLAIALVFVSVISYRKSQKANRKIHRQKESIEKKNESIKSSISYAQRIQAAMLPSGQTMVDYFQESFVLFQPRDTVSGDFYWCSEIQSDKEVKDLAFAAVDCTGHGVPGAFMSMVGMNSLNGIINRGIAASDHILSTLHSEIRTSLRQPETGNNDGMDIALCIYRKDRKVIEYAGAKNPLVYIQDNELIQIKGDIHPIGGSKSKPEIEYKKHEIVIDKPTMLYMFSDGYRDQFGGSDNTKFMSKKFNQLLLSIHALSLCEQKAILEKTIQEWKGDHHQTDDILIVGVRLS